MDQEKEPSQEEIAQALIDAYKEAIFEARLIRLFNQLKIEAN